MEQEKKGPAKEQKTGKRLQSLRACFTGIGVKRLGAAALILFVVLGTALTRDSLHARTKRTQAVETEPDYGYYVKEEPLDGFAPRSAAVNGAAYALDDTAAWAEEALVMDEASTAGETQSADTGSKIIRTAYLSLVSRSFDEDLAAIRALCKDAGGWIASSQESTGSGGLRTAGLTLRIPSSELDGFLSGASGIGRVTRRDESAEDVTESYQDTQTRLETQRQLMARLQSLVTEAASLKDLLDLESKIADTQYSIDRLQGSLNATDRKVDYATVDVSLREERAKEAATDEKTGLLRRIVLAFSIGLSGIAAFTGDMLVFLAAALPALLLIALAVLIVRRVRRSRAKR